MMRYIAQYIRPSTGTPSPGSSNTIIRHYANDRNALRFMHKHLDVPHFPAGQYRLAAWPEGTFTDREVGTLYKLV
jgi:hypothetical protein